MVKHIPLSPDSKLAQYIAEGDDIAVRWTATYTHTGTLLGIPRTGKRVTIAGVSIFRMSQGKAYLRRVTN